MAEWRGHFKPEDESHPLRSGGLPVYVCLICGRDIHPWHPQTSRWGDYHYHSECWGEAGN